MRSDSFFATNFTITRINSNLRHALVPRGWLEAQRGGGHNILKLRNRVNVPATNPKLAPFFEARQARFSPPPRATGTQKSNSFL
jgi:hypothetical protein